MTQALYANMNNKIKKESWYWVERRIQADNT
jgi:hypothetical protein